MIENILTSFQSSVFFIIITRTIMLKYFSRSIHNITASFSSRNLYNFTKQLTNAQKRMDLYKRIKEKSTENLKNKPLNPILIEKHYHNYRCDGCNSQLQSQDKQKYGFINKEVMDRSIHENIKLIESSYGVKVQNNDNKTMVLIQQVERQLGINIFNNKTKKLDHLDSVEVLLRLQQKIDKHEQQEQTIRRTKNSRNELFCYRCYTLKYHNKLPDEYDIPETLQSNNQEELINKIFLKHKAIPTIYIYVVDVLDMAGSFQEYVFKRLIEKDIELCLVINKLDILNQKYLNEHLVLRHLRQRIMRFVQKEVDNEEKRIKLEKIGRMRIFMVSSISKLGIKKLQEYIEDSLIKRIQFIGFPNTGKTTLLNQITRLSKPTSKVPGTTLFITESKYQKYLYYDMPGMYSERNLYNLIDKPNQKSLLTWNKFYSPPIMIHSAFFFGGKVQIKDTKIILFGLGGACSSDNRWFLLNYKQFWKGLPNLNQLKMKKHEFQMIFQEGETEDLQIAGYGFISFRLAYPNTKKVMKKLTLYLPEQINFNFRQSVLKDSDILHYKSAVTKRHRLQRVHEQKKKRPEKKRPKVAI